MFDGIGKNIGIAVLSGASMISLAGCSASSGRLEYSGRLEDSGPAMEKNLGQGIYQLSAEHWPESLVQFRREHLDREILDTQVATTTGHGYPTSFIVVTKPKE